MSTPATVFPKVLQLNNSGMPVGFIHYEDAVCAYAKGHVVWELGDEDFTIYGGHSRMTGEQSHIQVRPIIAIRSGGSSDGSSKMNKVPRLTNQNLFARDKNICAYCVVTYSREQLTRDHIIPVSKGGKDTWMNCITACKVCNNIKSDRTPEKAGMPLAYLPYIPTHAENLILQNRNILASQLDFLRPMISPLSRVTLPEIGVSA